MLTLTLWLLTRAELQDFGTLYLSDPVNVYNDTNVGNFTIGLQQNAFEDNAAFTATGISDKICNKNSITCLMVDNERETDVTAMAAKFSE